MKKQWRVRTAVLHGLLKHKGKLQLKMDGMEKNEISELKNIFKREILFDTPKTD